MSEPVVLILVTFDETDRADQFVKELQKRYSRKETATVLAASVLVKTKDGHTKVTETLDFRRQKGERFGALAGGALGLLVGPVGVLVGAAAGGLAGRAVSPRKEVSLSETLLAGMLDNMRPGTSTVVALAEEALAQSLKDDLESSGGRVHQQRLTSEEVAALVAEAEEVDVAAAYGIDMNDVHRAEAADIALESQINALVSLGTRPGPRFATAHVVVNPAAGKDQPILNRINAVFHAAGMNWTVSVTQKAGDGVHQARAAAENGADVVAAYGGDGTVVEVANGLFGTGVPMAILPGGTSNVVAVDLGIPKDLIEAAALLCGAPSQLRDVDMGRSGDRLFILRADVGFFAAAMGASRELKDRIGGLAYTVTGLRALRDSPVSHYEMILDGESMEIDGFTCLVLNSGGMGIYNLPLFRDVDVSDGLFDVVVLRKGDLDALIEVAGSVANVKSAAERIPRWRAKEVRITADPPQMVAFDGDQWREAPLEAQVVPGAARILVPQTEVEG